MINSLLLIFLYFGYKCFISIKSPIYLVVPLIIIGTSKYNKTLGNILFIISWCSYVSKSRDASVRIEYNKFNIL